VWPVFLRTVSNSGVAIPLTHERNIWFSRIEVLIKRRLLLITTKLPLVLFYDTLTRMLFIVLYVTFVLGAYATGMEISLYILRKKTALRFVFEAPMNIRH